MTRSHVTRYVTAPDLAPVFDDLKKIHLTQLIRKWLGPFLVTAVFITSSSEITLLSVVNGAVVTVSMKPNSSEGSCALSEILSRVRTRLSWCFVLAMLLGAPSAFASPYTVDFTPGYANHWEDLFYDYEPSIGWSESPGGNNHEMPGYINVAAKDGSFGQSVDVKLTFELKYSLSYLGYGTPGYSNADFSADSVTATAYFSGDVFNGPVPSKTFTFAAMESGTVVFAIDTPFIVGMGENPMSVGLFLGHPSFSGEHATVFDDTKPAQIAVTADMRLRLTSAEVIGVHESGLTIALLGVTLAGVFFLKRRVVESG